MDFFSILALISALGLAWLVIHNWYKGFKGSRELEEALDIDYYWSAGNTEVVVDIKAKKIGFVPNWGGSYIVSFHQVTGIDISNVKRGNGKERAYAIEFITETEERSLVLVIEYFTDKQDAYETAREIYLELKKNGGREFTIRR